MDLSASVGFIHKESFTMHGHTIVKFGYMFRPKRAFMRICVKISKDVNYVLIIYKYLVQNLNFT